MLRTAGSFDFFEGIGESLAKKIEMEADILLSAMDLEEICEAVYFDLDQIEVQELWDRSGKSRYGYVSPEEMAFEMMENELAPYNEDVLRYIELEKYTKPRKATSTKSADFNNFDLSSDKWPIKSCCFVFSVINCNYFLL